MNIKIDWTRTDKLIQQLNDIHFGHFKRDLLILDYIENWDIGLVLMGLAHYHELDIHFKMNEKICDENHWHKYREQWVVRMVRLHELLSSLKAGTCIKLFHSLEEEIMASFNKIPSLQSHKS